MERIWIYLLLIISPFSVDSNFFGYFWQGRLHVLVHCPAMAEQSLGLAIKGNNWAKTFTKCQKGNKAFKRISRLVNFTPEIDLLAPSGAIIVMICSKQVIVNLPDFPKWAPFPTLLIIASYETETVTNERIIS